MIEQCIGLKLHIHDYIQYVVGLIDHRVRSNSWRMFHRIINLEI